VLYVGECPYYAGALALVERGRAELGIDTELRTSLIGDQAAERARCTALSTGWLVNPPNAWSATPCWQPARPTPRQNPSSAPQPTSV
jgi:hypothetical protein